MFACYFHSNRDFGICLFFFCEIYYTLSSKIYSEQLLNEINEDLENHGGNPPKEKVIRILFRKRTFFGHIKSPRNLCDFGGNFVRKAVRESMFEKAPFYRRLGI